MDEELQWQTFLNGDKKSLSQIFLANYNDLFLYGLKLSGNSQLVKDCIQDFFLKLWKNRDNLNKTDNIRPYLFKSLRNHVLDSMELLAKNTTKPINDEILVFYADDFQENFQINKDMKNEIIQAVNHLSVRQREVIYLRYFDEMDLPTISIVMGMNVQSIRNLICRSLKALRGLLNGRV